jgi:hypothetical protein
MQIENLRYGEMRSLRSAPAGFGFDVCNLEFFAVAVVGDPFADLRALLKCPERSFVPSLRNHSQ